MFRGAIIMAVSMAAGAAVMGCATQSERELEQKVQAEQPATGPDAIAARGAQTFISAPGLTDEQRRQLLEIHTRVYAENTEIGTEIGKAKSLLFKNMIAEKYDAATVAGLKKKLIGLDQRRLNVMFKALEDVEKVVGRGLDKEPIYRRFYEFDHAPGAETR